ncbi:TPA: hypothetical protein ACH3X2_007015 [Trebouxia sp. C0005]
MKSTRQVLVTLLSAALCAGVVHASTRDLLATNIIEDVSIPYNAAIVGTDPLNQLSFSDPRVQRTVSGLAPEQIHLTYLSDTQTIVSWATGYGNTTVSPVDPNYFHEESGPSSTVYWGTNSGNYTHNLTANAATITYYNQIYTFANANPNYNYSSPLFHHVVLSNLVPSTTYFYKVGDTTYGLSSEYNFTSPPKVGNTTYPFVLGVVADPGLTINTTVTIQHLVDANPQVWTLIGDFTYADDMQTNGTTTTTNGSSLSYVPSPEGTYQPWWDMWFRYYSNAIASRIPLLPNHGNHELEPQYLATYASGLANGTQFQSYVSRNPTNIVANASGSDSPLWYSANAGPAHMIYLSNYADFSVGSDQYNWLVQDLATFNRKTTPWLVATFHAPWYSSYVSHYKENECMRLAMESVLYNAGVDIVINGHCHEYERSNPVYNFTVDECGPVHITMGDGGNIEGLYKTFADTPGLCPTPNKTVPAYQPGGYCPTYVYDGNFCASSQPSWSAFREPAYGHGILTFENSTHTYWQWNRNLDNENIEMDTVYVIRQLSCSNKAGY